MLPSNGGGRVIEVCGYIYDFNSLIQLISNKEEKK